MNIYPLALKYFKELTCIPRRPLHEDKARNWIIQWAQKHEYAYTVDITGNVLIVAPGLRDGLLGLQSHIDMVCVSDGAFDFDKNPITVIEKDGKISAKKTSLGADNGIGVATMIALAEIEDRPSLELLFTIGEEVGLVGAQHISLPIKAPFALNLDWSDSDTIGIGCGGTLLMQGVYNLTNISSEKSNNTQDVCIVRLQGMQGGHSGEDIRHYRGNALIEILKIIQEVTKISHIAEISGGEADNAIPYSAQMIVNYTGHPNLLKNELSHLQKNLRNKYKCDTITLSVEENVGDTLLYSREDILPVLSKIIDAGTGVQIWGKNNTPLSSWNLGIFSMKNTKICISYFLRTNQEDGIKPMQDALVSGLPEIVWTLSHESPVWNQNNPDSPLLKSIQREFLDEENVPLPTITTHAAVECGILAKKYPQTEWISVGATISDMHTTRESIEARDFEKFVERMQKLLGKF